RSLSQLDVDLAVQQPQRIALYALMAVVAQFGKVRPSVVQYRGAERGPAVPASQRIDFELELQPEVAAQVVDHHQQLGVASSVGSSEHLDAELIKLAVAPLLRTLAA